MNSANLGPYGDAIVQELIPYLEKKYRGIGQGWARFMYGGSTGGWEAMAAQVFYPEAFNGAYIACPDPIDFRAFTTVDLYKDKNAYWLDDTFKRTPRPGHRNWLGHVDSMLWEVNRLELVLGTRTRSGQQYDIWEAVFSPVGRDGYPERIWDKGSGDINKDVADYWRENYDLVHILKRDWEAKGLGKKLEGKLHIYVGDMDNYYLNNAVYLAEEFLESTRNAVLQRRSRLRRSRRALLERRPDARQRLLAAALPPDVHAARGGADAEDGAGRRRPHELAILTRLAAGSAASDRPSRVRERRPFRRPNSRPAPRARRGRASVRRRSRR